MLRFKQFLTEAPSIEQQLTAIRNYENAIKDKNKFGMESIFNVLGPDVAPGQSSTLSATSKDSPISSVISTISGGKDNEFHGAYHAPSKTAVMYNLQNPDKNLTNNKVFRHEMAHAYQDLAQTAQGKKSINDVLLQTKPNFRPNIHPSLMDKNLLDFPEYSYSDVEINARAVQNTMDAQDWYKKALEHNMRYIDKNDKVAIQQMKDKLRSHAMEIGLQNEVGQAKNNIDMGRSVDSVLKVLDKTPNSERKITDAANKAEKTTRVKIARGLAQVENEFEMPSQAIGGSPRNLFGLFGKGVSRALPWITPEGAAEEAAAMGLESLGLRSAGAAVAPLFINQSAGDPIRDMMVGLGPEGSKRYFEELENASKRRNVDAVSNIINRPYNPSAPTPSQR